MTVRDTYVELLSGITLIILLQDQINVNYNSHQYCSLQ